MDITFGLFMTTIAVVLSFIHRRYQNKIGTILSALSWLCIFIAQALISSTSYSIFPSLCFFGIIYLEWGGREKTEIDERKNIPMIVRVVVVMLVFYLIPGATRNIQQDLTLEKATERFPTIEIMQEIVGEEIPIKGTHDQNKLNDRVIVQNFSFSPVEETDEIPVENLFAKSRHSISYHLGNSQMYENIEGTIGQLKVNDFIVRLDYRIKDDQFLEVSYRGYNDKISISGDGVISNKEISDKDRHIIEDKVTKIIASF